MATRICSYQNGQFRCKNWVANSPDDDTEVRCPVHAGVIKREPSEAELKFRQRFEQHVSLCESMSDDELIQHSLQLEALLEDVKLRIQANAKVRLGRAKLAEAMRDKAEIQQDIDRLRFPHKVQQQSKEEKEIAKVMKLGLSREQALQVLGFN